MRKVTVHLGVTLQIVVDEGVEVSEIINELEYDFSDTTGKADVTDMEIQNHEIIDSK